MLQFDGWIADPALLKPIPEPDEMWGFDLHGQPCLGVFYPLGQITSLAISKPDQQINLLLHGNFIQHMLNATNHVSLLACDIKLNS